MVGGTVGQEQPETDSVDRLLDDIRRDWRRLGAAEGEDMRQRIRKQMQRSFDELRQQLDAGAD